MSIVATFGATGALVPLFALPTMVVTDEAAAKATGIATSAAMTGAIASTFLGGWLIGATDGYVVPFAVYSAVTAAALVVIFPLASAALRQQRRAAAA